VTQSSPLKRSVGWRGTLACRRLRLRQHPLQTSLQQTHGHLAHLRRPRPLRLRTPTAPRLCRSMGHAPPCVEGVSRGQQEKTVCGQDWRVAPSFGASCVDSRPWRWWKHGPEHGHVGSQSAQHATPSARASSSHAGSPSRPQCGQHTMVVTFCARRKSSMSTMCVYSSPVNHLQQGVPAHSQATRARPAGCCCCCCCSCLLWDTALVCLLNEGANKQHNLREVLDRNALVDAMEALRVVHVHENGVEPIDLAQVHAASSGSAQAAPGTMDTNHQEAAEHPIIPAGPHPSTTDCPSWRQTTQVRPPLLGTPS